jgi:hypothetical protein
MSQQLDDFREACECFDWQYEFSDDHSVFRRGRKAQATLFSEATRIGPDALDVYFEFVERNRTNG